jgi:hypothetical protein
METTMRMALSIPAAAALSLLAAGPALAEYPTFQLDGLPITRHQAQLIGSAHLKEMLPAPRATATMAASPHQALVLTPRKPAERQLAASTAQTVQLALPRPRPAR